MRFVISFLLSLLLLSTAYAEVLQDPDFDTKVEIIHLYGQDIRATEIDYHDDEKQKLKSFIMAQAASFKMADGNHLQIPKFHSVFLTEAQTIRIVIDLEKFDWKLPNGQVLPINCSNTLANRPFSTVAFYENGRYEGHCGLSEAAEINFSGHSIVATASTFQELNRVYFYESGLAQLFYKIDGGSIQLAQKIVHLRPKSGIAFHENSVPSNFVLATNESFQQQSTNGEIFHFHSPMIQNHAPSIKMYENGKVKCGRLRLHSGVTIKGEALSAKVKVGANICLHDNGQAALIELVEDASMEQISRVVDGAELRVELKKGARMCLNESGEIDFPKNCQDKFFEYRP